MRILAVDTTTSRGSLALVAEDETLGEVRVSAPDSHSTWLVPGIAFLLGALGFRPRDVDGYAVAAGPGSFTGLRVGLATVQGLALASGRPCLGLSALDALGASIAGTAPTLVALMDAHRDEVYAACFDADGRPLAPPRVSRLADVLQVEGPAAFVGEGAVRYREEILATRRDALFPPCDLHLAPVLARMAGPRFARGDGTGPGSLRPLYLRDADIRKPMR